MHSVRFRTAECGWNDRHLRALLVSWPFSSRFVLFTDHWIVFTIFFTASWERKLGQGRRWLLCFVPGYHRFSYRHGISEKRGKSTDGDNSVFQLALNDFASPRNFFWWRQWSGSATWDYCVWKWNRVDRYSRNKKSGWNYEKKIDWKV